MEYLEGRELTPKPDYPGGEQRAEVEIAAPAAAVYDSLLDPATFRRWFGSELSVERHVGGRWAMGGPEGGAKILDLRPERRITLGWPDGMVSTWELEGSAGRTRLTFTQSGFTEPPHAGWTGWLGGLVELRRFHEIPDWRPLWLSLEMPGLPAELNAVGQG